MCIEPLMVMLIMFMLNYILKLYIWHAFDNNYNMEYWWAPLISMHKGICMHYIDHPLLIVYISTDHPFLLLCSLNPWYRVTFITITLNKPRQGTLKRICYWDQKVHTCPIGSLCEIICERKPIHMKIRELRNAHPIKNYLTSRKQDNPAFILSPWVELYPK